MSKIINVISFILFICLSSCAVVAKDIQPTQSSFAKVQAKVELFVFECKEEEKKKKCNAESKGIKLAFGSGMFFKYKGNTAFLSAGHVCLGPAYEWWNHLPNKSKVKTEIILESYTGKEIRGKIKYINIKHDLCVIETIKKTKLRNIPKISSFKPRMNEKVYTLSAPYGIFHVGVVPLLEGRYIGDQKIFSFYTIPSAPGSSGAAVLNSKNMIVGIVQRTHAAFNHVTLSIKHKDLVDSLDYYLDMKARQIEFLIE